MDDEEITYYRKKVIELIKKIEDVHILILVRELLLRLRLH